MSYAAQKARALELLRREMRRIGVAIHPALAAELEGLIEFTAGHSGPIFDADADALHAAGMLVLSFEEAGLRLGRSSSTVKRLVSAGELPAVIVGGTRCIRSADLAEYVAGLEPVRNAAGSVVRLRAPHTGGGGDAA